MSGHRDEGAAVTERGVVLKGTGGIWCVRDAAGQERQVSMRGRLKKEGALKLAVGDEVVIEENAVAGSWAIAEILPRRSTLARRTPGGGHGERVVAANIDQAVIVFAAASPEPHPRMLDRFLVVAEANEIPAVIVINKVDLIEQERVRERFADYESAGYSLHLTSVKRHLGLDELTAALHRRVSALSGPSGVGKSSLVNAIFPGLNLRVGEISPSVNKGRHTTVGAEMHPLPDGGYVVDTPGLREVGMWGLSPDGLDRCFREFRARLGHCRFGDCSHRTEPGCAVREGVKEKTISVARYESYLKLWDELLEGTPAW
ncbi:MAG: ribosome small subunit-dependent GTPase A [Gemmatimonadota bacterium]|nr:ribosome small subunit-dependent GTPase A [Gemmatimonadota bacterium]